MSTHLPRDTVSDDVTPEWLDAHLPTVFSRWHPQIDHLLHATSTAIIDAADVQVGQSVVDVGCGSGIPALAIAEVVGPAGLVTATDPSPIFLAALAENVRAAGLTNVAATEASAAGLPFPPASTRVSSCPATTWAFVTTSPSRATQPEPATPRPQAVPRTLTTLARAERTSPNAWRTAPRLRIAGVRSDSRVDFRAS